ncbi:MAG: 50S ribosomal protein L6 [Gammaproteobacteria bacterium]|jgi:large subunit ribosomal protein L6|nr:50S ribosomal protein L6 [Gammaproteobacteria bacterium]MBT4615501.1 50S ribosomal protein L6 [Gammaproteobacteria bacterium]MBT5443130.1 50S ribosomal protein L6 [Gammaproteobacteria bacterium]MBT6570239.1 50S ribosomal protein L6 [Gammaproteobacteria bacterium]MBT6665844.1 50S ribosomal protein L6 [Gammaproteobacteria bacterium]
MSRIANNPVSIPKGVEITLSGQEVTVKGSKGNLAMTLHDLVGISQEEDRLQLKAVEVSKKSVALAGTFRSLVNNMVVGVSSGFQKELQLQGVGYRAQAQGKKLNLSLGFSHPVVYEVPEGIDIETPTQTQVIVKGIDKQLVGQVSADIRAFRPPEPYKGKGVRYVDEYVKRKEAKKK